MKLNNFLSGIKITVLSFWNSPAHELCMKDYNIFSALILRCFIWPGVPVSGRRGFSFGPPLGSTRALPPSAWRGKPRPPSNKCFLSRLSVVFMATKARDAITSLIYTYWNSKA